MRRPDPLKTCIHLRYKNMYYEAGAPDAPEEADDAHGSPDATVCWCLWTQTCRGPDQGIVGIKECAGAERKCFVGIESLA